MTIFIKFMTSNLCVILPATGIALYALVTKHILIYLLFIRYAGTFPANVTETRTELIRYLHLVPKSRIYGTIPPLSRKPN